jgi:secondary thiamine-phosphate synthase enzyme
VKLQQEHLSVRTRGQGFVNITSELRAAVERSKVQTGLLTAFVRHTSASLVISENADPAVLRDLQRWISELAPEHRNYEHSDEGADDMPAHLRSVLTRTSEQVPISEGQLVLGIWQAVYLWEHRRAAHSREIFVHIAGT